MLPSALSQFSLSVSHHPLSSACQGSQSFTFSLLAYMAQHRPAKEHEMHLETASLHLLPIRKVQVFIDIFHLLHLTVLVKVPTSLHPPQFFILLDSVSSAPTDASENQLCFQQLLITWFSTFKDVCYHSLSRLSPLPTPYLYISYLERCMDEIASICLAFAC